MYFCPNCGKTSETEVAFCSACGTAMKPQGVPTAPAAPVYAPVYAPATSQSAPASSKPALGKAIAGMAMGIAGFVFALLGILYVFMGLTAEPALGFGFSIGFGIFSLPLSIVGMVLSKGAINEGSTSSMASVGKKLGTAGMIVSFVMLFLGFIALIGADPYYYM